jgi:hypothetical protein
MSDDLIGIVWDEKFEIYYLNYKEWSKKCYATVPNKQSEHGLVNL